MAARGVAESFTSPAQNGCLVEVEAGHQDCPRQGEIGQPEAGNGRCDGLAGQELVGELVYGQHDGEHEQQHVEGALGDSHERGRSWPGPGHDAAAQGEGVVEMDRWPMGGPDPPAGPHISRV